MLGLQYDMYMGHREGFGLLSLLQDLTHHLVQCDSVWYVQQAHCGN